MEEELLKQKEYWEKQLAITLNYRNNPFVRQMQWSTKMKPEDFDEQVAYEKEQIARIVEEIRFLTKN